MTDLTPHRWFRITYGPTNFNWIDAGDTEGNFNDTAQVNRANTWLLAATPEQLEAAGAEECTVIGAPGHPLLFENYTAPTDLTVQYTPEAKPLETARTNVLNYIATVKAARQALEAAEQAKADAADEISTDAATADFEDFADLIAAAEALDPDLVAPE
jgi:hypothetical protein